MLQGSGGEGGVRCVGELADLLLEVLNLRLALKGVFAVVGDGHGLPCANTLSLGERGDHNGLGGGEKLLVPNDIAGNNGAGVSLVFEGGDSGERRGKVAVERIAEIGKNSGRDEDHRNF